MLILLITNILHWQWELND